MVEISCLQRVLVGKVALMVLNGAWCTESKSFASDSATGDTVEALRAISRICAKNSMWNQKLLVASARQEIGP